MNASAHYLNPSEAAKRLGISAKALRIYEQQELLIPRRTAAGWRVYGPDELARATEIIALRDLGLSLGQVARALEGHVRDLEPALAAHQATLERRVRQLASTIQKVGRLRSDVARGKMPDADELSRVRRPFAAVTVAFDLPWPWGGERFELPAIRPLNYIVGPLGCGKTRLAKRLAETLPDAAFVGLERLAGGGAEVQERLAGAPALKSRVDQILAWLVEYGATVSEPLVTLLVALEADGPGILVIDMLEQGLDSATQEALIAWLRRRAPEGRRLFCLTRSSSILDLDSVGPDEQIILCPANHSPPTLVAPYRGAPGYESLATCLATPEVRARTEGVIAWRPEVA